MEQIPQDTAKQILQSREQYGTALTQAGAPIPFSQAQTTFGAQGQTPSSFLGGIQQRQAAAAQQKQAVQQISAAQSTFETSVAQAYPSLGQPTYVDKAYQDVVSQLQTGLKNIDSQIASLQKSLSTATGSTATDLTHQIDALQQGRNAYTQGLGMSKTDAISYGADYFNQLSNAYQQNRMQTYQTQAQQKVQTPTPSQATIQKTYQTYLGVTGGDTAKALSMTEAWDWNKVNSTHSRT